MVNGHNLRSCPPHFTDQVEREKNHQETVNPMKYWAIISESEEQYVLTCKYVQVVLLSK